MVVVGVVLGIALLGVEVHHLALGGPHHPGHVRFAGESWLAVNGDGSPIPVGTPVVVTAVRGTTLVGWSASEVGLERPLGGSATPPDPEKGTS